MTHSPWRWRRTAVWYSRRLCWRAASFCLLTWKVTRLPPLDAVLTWRLGCNLLLPSYLAAVRRVMGVRPSDSAGPATESVRAACIRLLGLMLPYPNHYETTELRHLVTSGPLAKVRSYHDLLPHIGASLLEALSTEPFGPNVHALLNLCVTFHQLYATDDPRFFHLALSWIVNALLPTTWTREVQATMLRTLAFLAQLAPPKLEDKPRQVLGTLTRLLLQLVKGSGEMDAQLVQLTLSTICEWYASMPACSR
jgi:hypothetical protein